MAKTSPARMLFYFLVIVGIILLITFAWFQKKNDASPQRDRGNVYDADLPSSVAVVDQRMMMLSPQVIAQVPTIDYLTHPMGTDLGGFTYDAQGFGEWNAKRGGKHRGQDWNGIGGEDTDLGDTVYSVGRGKVVYAGQPSPDWGNMVVLMHKLPDGRYVQSLYAHLDCINVVVGQLIPRGVKIGTVGTANGNYKAHLHFEMIQSVFNEAGMRAYGTTGNRLNPEELFEQYALPENEKIPDFMPILEKVELEAFPPDMTVE